jgi:hypothetical protein
MAVECINEDTSGVVKATSNGAERKELPSCEFEYAENGFNSSSSPSLGEGIEPELHARTYIALAAMILLNFIQILALQGPPTVVCAKM